MFYAADHIILQNVRLCLFTHFRFQYDYNSNTMWHATHRPTSSTILPSSVAAWQRQIVYENHTISLPSQSLLYLCNTRSTCRAFTQSIPRFLSRPFSRVSSTLSGASCTVIHPHTCRFIYLWFLLWYACKIDEGGIHIYAYIHVRGCVCMSPTL